MIHWDNYPPETLCDIARAAFALGLADGRERAKPRDSHQVMAWLQQTYFGQRRAAHRIRMRQVYFAGFDLMKGKP